MASRAATSTAVLVLFNLLFFTMVSSSNVTCPPTTSPTTTPQGHGHGNKDSKGKCPKDTLKMGVCGNLLKDLMRPIVGNPPKTPCCTLIWGLADLEAVICLCTAIKANVLGVNLNIPLSLTLLLNCCGKKIPSGFKCA
ncbi:Bifunctional inhibitor/lipid-transfer protein/seed storage 2S albumin superfamily protein [Perilla frutescens var. hirtella]|uniref:Bifunctional inhibitor/lipid-transfer protein/seed storage 2S albumin superfamily protein n=1 Tax=Perilla frutescens var. hirtella TaxID=608512 RepID=A0AAD4IVU6_PERFH|nr:Bifunctional inhibitor/lipid-transfer protein/seed storage 2S albumin superfamily protein [Perilla frutescens var. hirtella]